MPQKYHCEILLNNYLDINFQAMMRPLNLMQYIFFLPKYTIRDNFITPVGFLEKGALIFGLLFYTIFFIIHTYNTAVLKSDLELQSQLLYTMYFNLFTYLIGFITNFTSQYFLSKLNVQIILLLQNINRIKFNNGDKMKQCTRQNWIYFYGFFTFIIAYRLYIVVSFSTEIILETIAIIAIMSFDMNIIHASQIQLFIQKEIDMWCFEMEYDARTYSMGGLHVDKKYYYRKMVKIYVDILKAYDIYKKVYQALVSTLPSLSVIMMLSNLFCYCSRDV